MAATTQSTQRIAQVAAALNFADRIDDKRQIEGEVQYAFIDVPLTTDNAAEDVIELIELPPGAIPIPELSHFQVTDDATSGALTGDVGDIVDPDRYCDGANLASTGRVEFMAPAVPDGYTNRHKVVNTGAAATSTNLILLTLATFTATIEAGVLRVVLAYKSL